jgi:hypothetical protein
MARLATSNAYGDGELTPVPPIPVNEISGQRPQKGRFSIIEEALMAAPKCHPCAWEKMSAMYRNIHDRAHPKEIPIPKSRISAKGVAAPGREPYGGILQCWQVARPTENETATALRLSYWLSGNPGCMRVKEELFKCAVGVEMRCRRCTDKFFIRQPVRVASITALNLVPSIFRKRVFTYAC